MKSCTRCGRSGSHAFRRTQDGLYECSTITACRARARRAAAGTSRGGRGHPAGARPVTGVAYVIGRDGALRELVEGTLRHETRYSVAVAQPTRSTLVSLGLRNVQLIAVEASCLASVGFRNEFSLRRREAQLRSVPVIVYGAEDEVVACGPREVRTWQIGYRQAPEEVADRLPHCLRQAGVNHASPPAGRSSMAAAAGD